MKFLATMTSEQLHRLHRKIRERIAEPGGWSFGFDLRTLKINNPPLARAYIAVVSEVVRRHKED